MNTNHIPYDITGTILTKMNKHIKYLLDDEVLLRFIIKYSNIHPETLLIWFVKEQRQKALVLYTNFKRQEVLNISENVIILLCKTAIKNTNTNIFTYIFNIYFNTWNNKEKLFKSIVSILIDVYMKTKCVKWIIVLKSVLSLTNYDYVVNTFLLVKILEKDKSKRLIKLFLDTQSINIDVIETKVIYYIIIYNHLNLLQCLVVNGYEVTIYDIIISISSSNCKMIRYILKYFKPRLYTRGFRRLLLSTAAKRNNQEIYTYVYQRVSK